MGPSWWLDLVEPLDPAPVDFTASLPSFALAFGLAAVASHATRRTRTATVPA